MDPARARRSDKYPAAALSAGDAPGDTTQVARRADSMIGYVGWKAGRGESPMSWRSWLFPTSPEAQAEKLLRETARAVKELHQPIDDLTLAIVSAGWKCSQSVKPHLRPVKEFAEHPEVQEVYVFYEFLYFYLHLVNRQAHSRLGPDRVAKLQGAVGPLIVPAAVDTFFAHWPEKFKSGIERNFYEKLNDAEMEYASCKLLFPEKKHLRFNEHMEGDGLFFWPTRISS